MSTPPIAKTVEHSFEHAGQTYRDDYTWLQDKNDPDVIAYLDAENAYTDAQLAPTKDLQEQLFNELRGRIAEDDSTYPEQYGEYVYYWRVEEGKQYRMFCRKHVDAHNNEQILLDENALAEGLEYCKIFAAVPSPNGRYLAYAVDVTGAFVFNLHIKDMHTGDDVGDMIANTAWTFAWASDNQTILYTLFDQAHRSYQIWRHSLHGGDDELVYHETDQAFELHVERTRSGAYLTATSHSATTSEVRICPADQPTAAFKLFAPRKHWVEYFVEHHDQHFLITTNDHAENFKLMRTSVHATDQAHWHEVLPHRHDTMIEAVQPFREHLVIVERYNGLRQVRISSPDGVSNVLYAQFPDAVYTFRPANNPEYGATQFRIMYSSLATPESTVDLDLADGAWHGRKQQVIPSGFNPHDYVTERIHAVAPDGVRVPMSLLYRKGLERNGHNPAILYGYGSYGFPTEAGFNPRILSLVDRGFVYAIGHIRGGNEMGRAWYENGRLMNKKNTFSDFIACGEALIEHGYTSSERLAIMGGSAGGLLVSAVVNMRPDLMRAAVAMVPFTNVITAMLMPDLPLTVIEYEQWGNPNDAEAFEYMLSYSPYENVEAKAYPAIYAKTGINDLQVPYWDPAKWVAKLRAHKTDHNRLVLRTNMGAGHGGASGRYDVLREVAEMYAFVLEAVGK